MASVNTLTQAYTAVVCIAVLSFTVFLLDVDPKKKVYAFSNKQFFGVSLGLFNLDTNGIFI